MVLRPSGLQQKDGSLGQMDCDCSIPLLNDAVADGENQAGSPCASRWENGVQTELEYRHSQLQSHRTQPEPATWNSVKWLSGTDILHVIAQALDKEGESNQLQHYKDLANQESRVNDLVREHLDTLTAQLIKHLKQLQVQDFATAQDQNSKFVQEAQVLMGYGNRDEFDGGLSALIGNPNDMNPLDEMYREHNEYDYAKGKVVSRNYGITTSMELEWRGVAGGWAPENRDFALIPSFVLPRETKGFGEVATGWKQRAAVCLYAFFPRDAQGLDSPEAHSQWWLHNSEDCLDPRDAEAVERGREEASRAKLLEVEVLALRLWSGPAYQEYNRVLRKEVGKRYMTTLHALCSGIFKLSKIGTSEVVASSMPDALVVVFRGFSRRAISTPDFERGFFVERGAMSFATNSQVARQYASVGKTTEGPSYVLEVRESEVDKGADISAFSYYPHEREKLYGPLCMLQIVGDKIEGKTLVLEVRVNVNAKGGTLEDIVSRRKGMLLNQAEILLRETRVAQSKQISDAAPLSRERFMQLTMQLSELGDRFSATQASSFNNLSVFGDANQELLRTLQGVWHLSLLEPRLAAMFSSESEQTRHPAATATTPQIAASGDTAFGPWFGSEGCTHRPASVSGVHAAPISCDDENEGCGKTVFDTARGIRQGEQLLKRLRTELLLRWLRLRVQDLQVYRALRFHSIGWVASRLAVYFLFVFPLLLQFALFVLRLPLEMLCKPLVVVGELLEKASTWTQRRTWAASNAQTCRGCLRAGMVSLLGALCVGLLALLRASVALLTTLTLGFWATRLEHIRGALKDGTLHAQLAMGCLNQQPTRSDCIPNPSSKKESGAQGMLTHTRSPWLEAFWFFLPSDCAALEAALAALEAEESCSAAGGENLVSLGDGEVQKRIETAKEKLEGLWRQGGVAAKDAEHGGQVSQRVRAAVGKLRAKDAASKLKLRRLQAALRCIQESCQTLPFSAMDVSPVLTREQWEVACRWGAQAALSDVDVVCTQARDVLGVPSSPSDGDDAYQHSLPAALTMSAEGAPDFSRKDTCTRIAESENRGQRSVERVVELFEYGTSLGSGAASEVVDTRLYDVWEARVLGGVSVVQHYMDAVNLEELALEPTQQEDGAWAAAEATLLLSTVTEAQAAFLVHFVGGNSLGAVQLQIGESRMPVRLEPRRPLPGEEASEQLRQLWAGKKDWGSLLGLDVRLCSGCVGPDVCDGCRIHGAGCLWLRPEQGIDKRGLTLPVLRVLAEAAEYHFARGGARPPIVTVDAYYNAEIGRRDGGREAVPLLMRTIACVAPDVEHLYLPYCGLGKAGMEALTRELRSLKRLRQMWLTFNPKATMHTHELRAQWRQLGRPHRTLSWAPGWNPRTGLFIDFAGDIGVAFMRLALGSLCWHPCTAQSSSKVAESARDEAC